MDFSFSEEQQELQNLAKQIFEGELSIERLKEVEGRRRKLDGTRGAYQFALAHPHPEITEKQVHGPELIADSQC